MRNTLVWKARGGTVLKRSLTKLNVQCSNPDVIGGKRFTDETLELEAAVQVNKAYIHVGPTPRNVSIYVMDRDMVGAYL